MPTAARVHAAARAGGAEHARERGAGDQDHAGEQQEHDEDVRAEL